MTEQNERRVTIEFSDGAPLSDGLRERATALAARYRVEVRALKARVDQIQISDGVSDEQIVRSAGFAPGDPANLSGAVGWLEEVVESIKLLRTEMRLLNLLHARDLEVRAEERKT